MHNPIVEQVVLETLRTVRDIWKQVGHIDEIHVELGREMKRSKEERECKAKQMRENEDANFRIKMLLTEFMNPSFGVEGVRPYSPYQQEKLRIYEDTVLNMVKKPDKSIVAIREKLSESNPEKRPTASEIMRYKCWLEQKYCSPYTGALIPLARLFTSDYEIEHIIPRSRYFDDSFSNKVICERAVNGLKDKMLGYEFIKANQGRRVQLGFGKEVNIFTLESYEKFVKDTYASNSAKMRKLLMEDIPEQFINRQLNDTCYISRLIKSLLSNIVREEGEQEDMSKNVIVCTGKVTDRLKRDWGINDVWNEIILPRFVRLNEKLDTTDFTSFNTQNKLIPSVPLELSKGFQKKRIDHRHHAMDAIVIACATRNIVNYLNNESASAGEKISPCDLRRQLCEKKKTDSEENARCLIRKPWKTFTQDVSAILQNIVVSFKQNLRVISKTTNYYQHYKDGKKQMIPQEKGDGWVVRKPLHQDTFYSEINLRRQKAVSLEEALKNPKAVVEKDLKKKLMELLSQGLSEKTIRAYFEENKGTWQDIDLGKINVYFFTKDTEKRFFSGRVSLDASLTENVIKKKIADTAIQKILLRHLERYNGDSGQAFSPEGIEQMNENIAELNNGRPHQPIFKVRKYEEATGKFPVGIKGNKSSKYVEAEKGTNLFFAVYEAVQENETTGETEKKRSFRTIPLNEVVRRRKEGLPPAPEEENGCRLKFVLSPNDLVYVPTKEELQSGNIMHPLNRSRIYKMVSCSGKRCHFIPACVAYPIIQTKELGNNNKDERAWSSEMIKEICVPIKVDRLGNIMETL